MNRADLLSQRLHSQKLSSPDLRKPVDVVRWFGAVQAQDFEAAKWALALRVQSATNNTIEDAFNRGTILRTHLMRPTWHFVAHDDIRWLLALTAPRVNLRCGPNYRKLELDDAIFKRSHKVLARALKNGKPLQRSELRTVLNESGVEANDGIRLGHILLRAELDGVVCSGTRIDKQCTYALFDERVPPTKTIARDEALAKLTRRYFRSHGPATLQDFVWWSGLNTADARRGIELVERDVEKVIAGEKVHWNLPSIETSRGLLHTAHLLPAFDEYFVAYKDRDSVFDPRDGQPALTTADLLSPTVIIDGTAVGRWKRNEKHSAGIELKLTRALKRHERAAIADAATRYAEFRGAEPSRLA
jgi:hypothetical protein